MRPPSVGPSSDPLLSAGGLWGGPRGTTGQATPFDVMLAVLLKPHPSVLAPSDPQAMHLQRGAYWCLQSCPQGPSSLLVPLLSSSTSISKDVLLGCALRVFLMGSQDLNSIAWDDGSTRDKTQPHVSRGGALASEPILDPVCFEASVGI